MGESIRELFDRVEADGKVTKEEVHEINRAIGEDGKLDYEERSLLEKMSEKIRNGELEEIP
ncbi:MAG: hypothetical protein KAI43_07295 [Candidatus Aureabacteria bacterium]|nr:hypothetical protein [Candidatus Auribacterota bacterium]